MTIRSNVILIEIAVVAAVCSTLQSIKVDGAGEIPYCNTLWNECCGHFGEEKDELVVDEKSCSRNCVKNRGMNGYDFQNDFYSFVENDDFFKCQCTGGVCFGFSSQLNDDDVRSWGQSMRDSGISGNKETLNWYYDNALPSADALLYNNFLNQIGQPFEVVLCSDISDITVKDQESCLEWCGEFTFAMFVPGPCYARCECFVPTNNEEVFLRYDFEADLLIQGGLYGYKKCVGEPQQQDETSNMASRCPDMRCGSSYDILDCSYERQNSRFFDRDPPQPIIYSWTEGWCEYLEHTGGRNLKLYTTISIVGGCMDFNISSKDSCYEWCQHGSKYYWNYYDDCIESNWCTYYDDNDDAGGDNTTVGYRCDCIDRRFEGSEMYCTTGDVPPTSCVPADPSSSLPSDPSSTLPSSSSSSSSCSKVNMVATAVASFGVFVVIVMVVAYVLFSVRVTY